MRQMIDRLKFYLNDERGFLGLGSIVGGVVGGLGGLLGGGGQQQTTTPQLPGWAQDYLRSYARQGANFGNAIASGPSLVTGVQPYTHQAAGAAQRGIRQAGDIFGFGQNLAQRALGGATAPIAGQIGQFQNPYLDEQMGRYRADLQRGLDLNALQTQQQATAAGAYGGARHGIAQGIGAADELNRYSANVLNARTQDRNMAMQAAFQNQAAQAGLLGQGIGTMGAGLQGQYRGAGMLGGFGEYLRNVANQQRQEPLMRYSAALGLRGQGMSPLGMLAGSKTSTTSGSPLSRFFGGAFTGMGVADMFGGGGGGGYQDPADVNFDQAIYG